MDNPIISIVVPVYNVEKYLDRCIESILAQSFKDFELILVNDGSSDSSAFICDKYKGMDKRVKVIHKENGGLSDARNKGIEIATGKYIGFVDSDDYIDKDMYLQLYELIEMHSADIAICDAVLVSDFEQPKFKNARNVRVLTKEQALKDMICTKTISVNAWNKLYKINLFDTIKYPKGMLYEDLDTTYKLIDLSNTIVISDAQKYAYVQRIGSIMNSTGYFMRVDKVKIISDMLAYFDARKFGCEYERYIAGIFMYLMNDIYKMAVAKKLSKNTEYLEALKELYQSRHNQLKSNAYMRKKEKCVMRLAVKHTKILEWFYCDIRKLWEKIRKGTP